MKPLEQDLSRRKFLGLAGKLLGVGAIARLLTGCEDEPSWGVPRASKTGISPSEGEYSFNKAGCFSVIKNSETGQKFVKFSSDCCRYDAIEITDGAFENFWGGVNGGWHCPTDGYGISGHFVNEDRAEGHIAYAYSCIIIQEAAPFVAERK